MCNVLLNHRTPCVETFRAAPYSTQADDSPDDKILDVQICKMSKKSSSLQDRDQGHWGKCWEIPEASKVSARQLLADS